MSISEPMHMSKPGPDAPRRIEVFTGSGQRRTWTVEEKTVCSVARRHGLTPQQLFTWRRGAKLRRDALEDAKPSFVRAVVDGSCSTDKSKPIDETRGPN